MKRLIWMGCFSYLLVGFAHIIVGSVLTEMLEHYNRDYSSGGTLISAQFSGFLIGVLSMPLWSKWLGRRGMVVLAIFCLFLAQLSYALLPPWPLMLAIGMIAGLGFGMIEAAIGSFIIDAVKKNVAVEMSKLEVSFGVGALIMPVISSIFIWLGYWQWGFAVLALFALALSIAWRFTSFGHFDQQLVRGANKHDSTEQDDPKSKPIIASRQTYMIVICLFILIFFLYVGLEMSIVNFLPSILIENADAAKSAATLSVSMFWLTVTVGRLVAGYIAEKIRYSRYLLMGSIGSLLALVGFALVQHLYLAYTFILILGLFMSGLFAIALVLVNRMLPGVTERTTSLVIAAGGLGGAVLPYLTGESMDRFPVQTTLWLFVLFAACLVAFILIAVRLDRALLRKYKMQA